MEIKYSKVTNVKNMNMNCFLSRIALCKLLAALLNTQVYSLNVALANTPFLITILDLFFKYSLNNFLHTQVS